MRPVAAFAAGHLPGSISIELRPQFASWLGWLVDPHRPVAFITDEATDREDLTNQCLNIGYEKVLGELDGGFPRWREAGLPTAQIPLAGADDLTRRQVIDIRQKQEYAAGHVPGAANIELGSLTTSALAPGTSWAEAGTASINLLGHPVVTMCAHGQRSMTAASILARVRGSADGVAVFTGSAEDWARHAGRSGEQGL